MTNLNFLDIPFIPKASVATILIDDRITPIISRALSKLSINWISVLPIDGLYTAIAGHPDIQCHPLGGNQVIVAPNVSESLKSQLIQHDFEIIIGNTILGRNYPQNIAYNVARIGKIAFHNTKYTDPILRKMLYKQGVELFHVNQGYTKCSIAIVDKNSIITSDKGIARISEKAGIDVLLIEPSSISLPGLDYGFIGGACGLVNNDTIAFLGRLEKHPDKAKIENFLIKRNKKGISLGCFNLYDAGGIVPLKEKNNN